MSREPNSVDPGKSLSPCTIYLVRHGQTDWNVEGILQGQEDTALNMAGQQQAHELQDVFKGLKFAAFYSSDLARARHTAQIIASPHGASVGERRDLRERNFGHLQGMPRSARTEISELAPDVEPARQLYERFSDQLLEISRQHLGEAVLVVAHAGPIEALLLHLGWFNQESPQFAMAMQNGAYLKLSCDGRNFNLVQIAAAGSSSSTRSE